MLLSLNHLRVHAEMDLNSHKGEFRLDIRKYVLAGLEGRQTLDWISQKEIPQLLERADEEQLGVSEHTT